LRVWATSANPTPTPAPLIHSANTAALDAIRSELLADTTNVCTTGVSTTGVSTTAAAPATGSGACSITTCAFVPAKPNDDTPARRGPCPTDGHRAGSVGMKSRVDASSIAGFIRVKCRFGGMYPRCTVNTALMKPAIPAAASR
jgi:Tfp pilus assembly protein PilW